MPRRCVGRNGSRAARRPTDHRRYTAWRSRTLLAVREARIGVAAVGAAVRSGPATVPVAAGRIVTATATAVGREAALGGFRAAADSDDVPAEVRRTPGVVHAGVIRTR